MRHGARLACSYRTFFRSLFTLFQVLTGESWAEVVARPLLFGYDGYSTSWFITSFYFASYIVIMQIVLINVRAHARKLACSRASLARSLSRALFLARARMTPPASSPLTPSASARHILCSQVVVAVLLDKFVEDPNAGKQDDGEGESGAGGEGGEAFDGEGGLAAFMSRAKGNGSSAPASEVDLLRKELAAMNARLDGLSEMRAQLETLIASVTKLADAANGALLTRAPAGAPNAADYNA